MAFSSAGSPPSLSQASGRASWFRRAIRAACLRWVSRRVDPLDEIEERPEVLGRRVQAERLGGDEADPSRGVFQCRLGHRAGRGVEVRSVAEDSGRVGPDDPAGRAEGPDDERVVKCPQPVQGPEGMGLPGPPAVLRGRALDRVDGVLARRDEGVGRAGPDGEVGVAEVFDQLGNGRDLRAVAGVHRGGILAILPSIDDPPDPAALAVAAGVVSGTS